MPAVIMPAVSIKLTCFQIFAVHLRLDEQVAVFPDLEDGRVDVDGDAPLVLLLEVPQRDEGARPANPRTVRVIKNVVFQS
jgi:hypothetical protein